MAAETERRKAEHIRICLDNGSQAKSASAGFDDIQFVHRALPEFEKQKIDLSSASVPGGLVERKWRWVLRLAVIVQIWHRKRSIEA